MTIRNFLKKYNAFNRDIARVDYHMKLLDHSLEDLWYLFPELNGKKDESLVDFILKIYEHCDADNPKYDSELDIKMTRFCLKTDKFYGRYNYPRDEYYDSNSHDNTR